MHGRHDHSPRGQQGSTQVTPSSHGHNQPRTGDAVQWQTPHLPENAQVADNSDEHRDLDLVEAAFIEGFQSASDPVSFLRLAQIAFEGHWNGTHVRLLRVECARNVNVANLSPHLGGQTFNYAPLPAKMVSTTAKLEFIYFNGEAVVALDLAQARAVNPALDG